MNATDNESEWQADDINDAFRHNTPSLSFPFFPFFARGRQSVCVCATAMAEEVKPTRSDLSLSFSLFPSPTESKHCHKIKE